MPEPSGSLDFLGGQTSRRASFSRNFPVKFPVCRELDWRPVRSALHRQALISKRNSAFRGWAKTPCIHPVPASHVADIPLAPCRDRGHGSRPAQHGDGFAVPVKPGNALRVAAAVDRAGRDHEDEAAAPCAAVASGDRHFSRTVWHDRQGEYVFPAVNSFRRPMSNNTLYAALAWLLQGGGKRVGFAGDRLNPAQRNGPVESGCDRAGRTWKRMTSTGPTCMPRSSGTSGLR